MRDARVMSHEQLEVAQHTGERSEGKAPEHRHRGTLCHEPACLLDVGGAFQDQCDQTGLLQSTKQFSEHLRLAAFVGAPASWMEAEEAARLPSYVANFSQQRGAFAPNRLRKGEDRLLRRLQPQRVTQAVGLVPGLPRSP